MVPVPLCSHVLAHLRIWWVPGALRGALADVNDVDNKKTGITEEHLLGAIVSMV